MGTAMRTAERPVAPETDLRPVGEALRETGLGWELARQLDPRWALHRARGRSGGTRSEHSARRWDAQYIRKTDLFDLETDARERPRYRFLLHALGDRPLGRTLELGCSIGVLTAMLAERSTTLVATDISAVALDAASERLEESGHRQVEFRQAELPGGVPKGPFNTVVASEVLCYLRAWEVVETGGRIVASLAPGGRLLVAHTRGYFPKHAISADHAVRLVSRAGGLRSVGRWSGRELRADLFERR